jgi:hypothetical protein
VPSKIRPGDWDYFFGPKAPRRGGPLRALSNLLIFGVVLALLGVGGVFALRSYGEQQTRVQQTAVAVATNNVIELQARTARALSTREARTAVAAQQQSTAAAAATPTVVAALGVGAVVAGGNLRSEPRVAPETVIGLIFPGDEVAFLEQQSTEAGPWFRIRITRAAPARGDGAVAEGAEGWASASLLSPPR